MTSHNPTSTTSSTTERYEYDPCGNVTVLDNDWTPDDDNTPDTWNSILFQGQIHMRSSGLHLVRNRIYHPSLGRWVQRDPISYADGRAGRWKAIRSGPLPAVGSILFCMVAYFMPAWALMGR
jgi:RHS repeat-associated protein